MKYFIFLFLFCISCNKDHIVKDSTVVAVDISLAVKNKRGDDLLNPENPNSFKKDEIKIFYLINGKSEEASSYYSDRGYDLDNPRSFSIFKYRNTNNYRIGIVLNADISEEFPITYIKWNSMDTDTIKCSILRKNNSEIINKVWLNGKIAWSSSGNTERFIQIIK